MKRFITELEGEIEVNSEENKGSTFTCLIPLKIAWLQQSGETAPSIQSKAPKKPASPEIAVQSDHSVWEASKKILLVEDNPVVQRAVKSQFERLKCLVDTAENGAQALEKTQKEYYDLMIFDLGLPDQDGCEVAIAVRRWQAQHHQQSMMVALSAHIDDQSKQRCFAAGMVCVLSKPLTPQQAQELLTLIATPSPQQASFQKETDHPIHHRRRHHESR